MLKKYYYDYKSKTNKEIESDKLFKNPPKRISFRNILFNKNIWAMGIVYWGINNEWEDITVILKD